MSFSQDNPEDRKRNGRNKIKYKFLDKTKNKDFESRDNQRIKKQIRSKIEQIREDELWEDWRDEIS
jgi:hypothetical protein